MKTKAPITTALNYSIGLALSLCAFGAVAAPLPYADSGVENTAEYTFTATTTGDIVAYFVGKGGAVYNNTVSMSVNGVSTGTYGLPNQSSSYGQSFILGSANAGDTIVFSINVLDTGENWYSAKSQNTDAGNHVYSSAFSGEEALIPSGVYVAFEDLTKGVSDFNYLDEQLVVTNITSAPAVPVPAAAWLLGSGLLGLAGVTRRRSAKD
jgi:hypothetical protein